MSDLTNLEISELYNGDVRVEFNPKTHRYTIIDKGESVKVPSVTTVLGVIDKSGPLVPWAINQTINLIRGALNPDEQYSTAYLEQVFEQAKKAARQAKQEAADIGTLAHNWLEQYFLTDIAPPEPERPEAANCITAALSWLHEHHLEKLGVERRIYSRKHKFSGTCDMYGLVNGKLTVLDWKSSKGLYLEYHLQTAAYVAALEEELGCKVEQRVLVRLGKEDGVFEAHVLPRSEQAKDFKAFKAALVLHNRVQESKQK